MLEPEFIIFNEYPKGTLKYASTLVRLCVEKTCQMDHIVYKSSSKQQTLGSQTVNILKIHTITVDVAQNSVNQQFYGRVFRVIAALKDNITNSDAVKQCPQEARRLIVSNVANKILKEHLPVNAYLEKQEVEVTVRVMQLFPHFSPLLNITSLFISQIEQRKCNTIVVCPSVLAVMLVETELLLVIVGFMVAFMLAFGLGANDVANSFGTSVGSKVLTLQLACILATICEIFGSVLLGGHVSATVRGGIIDLTRFNGTEDGPMRLMQGQVSSLCGACLWMLFATFLKIPVSATHSIVGATAGFGLVLFGFQGVQWMGILKIGSILHFKPIIVIFIPLYFGLVSSCLFLIIKYVVLVKVSEADYRLYATIANKQSEICFNIFQEQSLEPALNTLPFLYGVTVIINVFSVLYGGLHRKFILTANPTISPYLCVQIGSLVLNLPEIPLWLTLVCSPTGQVYDRPEEAQVFAFAQILTATFGSFVHGGNDVSNAIGPVIGLWIVSTTGNVLMTAKPAVWILFYGGVGISVGLWIWGRKVMETIGTDLTVITPSREALDMKY
ncbi:Sodium-dependent phosphate transporter 2 [Echinococcus granulosus]|uniref:Phosphate transporter n=1 Tax=Echinococcus granulosus TaxID=6210 RepID=W6UWX5_ECHGR|nr:Sodium-dependent phosphate transporter 2 [Echinococcus granulosus]EUB57989.1 Sodium-dependent phosphate transporter 2 [Echinococcus granulosus]